MRRLLLLPILLAAVLFAAAPSRAQGGYDGHTCRDAFAERSIHILRDTQIPDLKQKVRIYQKWLDDAESADKTDIAKITWLREQLAKFRDFLRESEGALAGYLGLPPCIPMPHRVTRCTACKEIADELNGLIDKYNERRARDSRDTPNNPLASYLKEIEDKNKTLDDCERECSLLPFQLLEPTPFRSPLIPIAPFEPPPAPLRPEVSMMPLLPGAQFYAGVTGGGATARSQVKQPGETTAETSTTTPDPTSNKFGLSGGLAGGLFGVETLSGPWRLGVESDIAGGEISGKTTAGCGVPCRTSNHWLATVRGRAGFDFGLVTPYVTGGLAVGDINARIGALPGGNTVAAGWTAGAGVQWPLTALGLTLPDAVTGRFEWLHVDLGNPRVCGPKNCGGVTNASFSSDIFRFGIAIPLSALLPR